MNLSTKRVLDALEKVKRCSNNWIGHCPPHDGEKPSLSISRGDNGSPLIHCHAGCSQEKGGIKSKTLYRAKMKCLQNAAKISGGG